MTKAKDEKLDVAPSTPSPNTIPLNTKSQQMTRNHDDHNIKRMDHDDGNPPTSPKPTSTLATIRQSFNKNSRIPSPGQIFTSSARSTATTTKPDPANSANDAANANSGSYRRWSSNSLTTTTDSLGVPTLKHPASSAARASTTTSLPARFSPIAMAKKSEQGDTTASAGHVETHATSRTTHASSKASIIPTRKPQASLATAVSFSPSKSPPGVGNVTTTRIPAPTRTATIPALGTSTKGDPATPTQSRGSRLLNSGIPGPLANLATRVMSPSSPPPSPAAMTKPRTPSSGDVGKDTRSPPPVVVATPDSASSNNCDPQGSEQFLEASNVSTPTSSSLIEHVDSTSNIEPRARKSTAPFNNKTNKLSELAKTECVDSMRSSPSKKNENNDDPTEISSTETPLVAKPNARKTKAVNDIPITQTGFFAAAARMSKRISDDDKETSVDSIASSKEIPGGATTDTTTTNAASVATAAASFEAPVAEAEATKGSARSRLNDETVPDAKGSDTSSSNTPGSTSTATKVATEPSSTGSSSTKAVKATARATSTTTKEVRQWLGKWKDTLESANSSEQAEFYAEETACKFESMATLYENDSQSVLIAHTTALRIRRYMKRHATRPPLNSIIRTILTTVQSQRLHRTSR